MRDHRQFCEAMTRWAGLRCQANGGDDHFAKAWQEVHRAIMKSCLLDRMFNCGEAPSKTPCPVHKGSWSGIIWRQYQAQAYADGCRCFMHKCGCTTGWQPDEHCGCGVKP